MNVLKLLIVLAIVGAGYHHWESSSGPSGPASAAASRSTTGFVALPRAEGQSDRAVFVVAAQDCPEEDAQRADRLAEDLDRKGIPVVRTHNVSFRFEGGDAGQAAAVSAVMRGPLPIVFVRGRAKANPSLADVMAEYGGA